MKRVCVFAHWDKDNIIDDYVIYYLNALKEVAETIIFVSDCDLENNETCKLDGIADYILAQKHGEYDFGSYKRGFFFAKEKGLEFDELIFANDSVYGPFYPLKPLFDKMEKKKCDWWGLTKNYCGILKVNGCLYDKYEPHIQSYFLCFNPNVFKNQIFLGFLNNVKKLNEKEDIIIKYELGLNKILKQAGFKSDCYIKTFFHYNNLVGFHWKELIINHKFPFLKTSIIKNNLIKMDQFKDIESIASEYMFPIELINDNLKRYKMHENFTANKQSITGIISYNIQNIYPIEIYLLLNFLYYFFEKKMLCTFRRFFRYIRNNF